MTDNIHFEYNILYLKLGRSTYNNNCFYNFKIQESIVME